MATAPNLITPNFRAPVPAWNDADLERFAARLERRKDSLRDAGDERWADLSDALDLIMAADERLGEVGGLA